MLCHSTAVTYPGSLQARSSDCRRERGVLGASRSQPLHKYRGWRFFFFSPRVKVAAPTMVCWCHGEVDKRRKRVRNTQRVAALAGIRHVLWEEIKKRPLLILTSYFLLSHPEPRSGGEDINMQQAYRKFESITVRTGETKPDKLIVQPACSSLLIIWQVTQRPSKNLSKCTEITSRKGPRYTWLLYETTSLPNGFGSIIRMQLSTHQRDGCFLQKHTCTQNLQFELQ